MSDGDGGLRWNVHTSGDFARGASAGGVSTEGHTDLTWAEGTVPSDSQPAGSDSHPEQWYCVQNTTGSTITSLDVSYTIWVLNNEGRATRSTRCTFKYGWKLHGRSSIELHFNSSADGSPAWTSVLPDFTYGT